MILRRIFLPVLALLLVACSMLPALSPSVQTENIDMNPLVETHDEYVRADGAMAEEARDLALAEGEALLALVASAPELTTAQLAGALEPVVDRYDGYLLAGWASLSPFQQRYLTRTSDLAREVAGLPLTEWPAQP